MNASRKLIGIVAALLIIGRVVVAASPSITQTEAESFITSFYHDMERSDLAKMVAHFDQSVQWYDSGQKDQSFIADTLKVEGKAVAVGASVAIPVTGGTGRFARARGYVLVGPGQARSLNVYTLTLPTIPVA